MIDEESKKPASRVQSCTFKRKITIKVSYLEIYNESINDLLDKNKSDLEVRDHKGGAIVEGLSSKNVQSVS